MLKVLEHEIYQSIQLLFAEAAVHRLTNDEEALKRLADRHAMKVKK